MKRIGEVAEVLGVCPDRLKRLEAAGLFTPQRDCAGQRRYDVDDVARLRALLYPASGVRSAHLADGTTNNSDTALAAAPTA